MYTDPATGNVIFFLSQLLVCTVIVVPVYGFGRFAYHAIRHNANKELPKPRFPWWSLILSTLACAWSIVVSSVIR